MDSQKAKNITLQHRQCTGCGACQNICDFDAINMTEDKKLGYYYPAIDPHRCVGCGKCMTVCPVGNSTSLNDEQPESYAVWASEKIRGMSSSGGAFSVLAEKIIEQGGIVCGAAFDQGYRVNHIFIDRANELYRLRGSKYVQSYIGNAYREIKKYLENGRKVLFSGTPCQVSGLKKFLGREYHDLITVDVVCYGSPGQGLWKRYLDENYDLDMIDSLLFRDKRQGWRAAAIVVETKDGKRFARGLESDRYEKAFHMRLMFRDSCRECEFAVFPRQGDLTLGDFWGIEEYKEALDDGKGTSLIIVNNDKGKRFLESLELKWKMKEKVSYQYSKENRLKPCTPSKITYRGATQRFGDILEKHGFNAAVDKVLENKFDVGIVANWSMRNFGAHLTHFALYHVVKMLGYEALMIERLPSIYGTADDEPKLFKENPYPKYALYSGCGTKAEIKKVNQFCSKFIVGSDQNWNKYWNKELGEFWFLDFIHDSKLKISYATSFGFEQLDIPEEAAERIGYFLHKFDRISVRESSGADICTKLFNLDVQHVLDPVFLCPVEVYDRLAEKSDVVLPEKYIFTYMLDRKGEEQLARFSEHPLVNVTDAYNSVKVEGQWGLKWEDEICVEDWLNYLKGSSFVITDSFHGMCFAIIYHKPFAVIVNHERGGARFFSLLEELGLQDRMTTYTDLYIDTVKTEAIDYVAVSKKLGERVDESISWLKESLAIDKKKSTSLYDIIDDDMDKIRFAGERYGQLIGECRRDIEANRMDIIENRKEIVNGRRDIEANRQEIVNNRADIVDNRKEIVNNRRDINCNSERLEAILKGSSEMMEENIALRQQIVSLNERLEQMSQLLQGKSKVRAFFSSLKEKLK